MKAAFQTLGCRLNQAETALVSDDLSSHGYEIIPWGSNADILVINSCAVTATASQKTRQAVHTARLHNPDAYIVLMGCDAKVDADKWAANGPDMVVPHPMTTPLSSLLAEHFKQAARPLAIPAGIEEDNFTIPGAARFSGRTRANLKVQDGCDFYCSYCIVPYTRGHARSRDINDVLREARELIDYGYKEIVLCGVNLTTYYSQGYDFADLLKELSAIPGTYRIRIGSAEPAPVMEKVIEIMRRSSRICRFLHMPLQYGENSILQRMERHYTAEEYFDIATEAARLIPGICLGADVITGFPGETDETFETCRNFIESIPFGLLHIFPYSVRPGTKAAGFKDKVPSKLANQRAAILSELGNAKAQAFAQMQLNKKLQVLVEKTKPSSGWSDNYLHVTLDTPVDNNSLVSACINSFDGKRELSGHLS